MIVIDFCGLIPLQSSMKLGSRMELLWEDLKVQSSLSRMVSVVFSLLRVLFSA